MLNADHQIANLRLVTDEAQIALGLSDDAADLVVLTIDNVATVGRVHLEASMDPRDLESPFVRLGLALVSQVPGDRGRHIGCPPRCVDLPDLWKL